jgi:glutathione S-transferase
VERDMSAEMKLYTFRLCPFAHRVRLTLAEKGLNAEAIEINLKDKPADFLSISPGGRVPVLVHGAKRIWESAVIMEYLEEAYPEPPLMPADPFERAEGRLWIDFANARLFDPTHRLIFERNPDRRHIHVQQLETAVRHLQHEGLSRRSGPYLLGDCFTLADIALYPWFEQLPTLENFSTFRMPAECGSIRAWMAAVAARPAVKECAQSDDWYADSYRRYLAA